MSALDAYAALALAADFAVYLAPSGGFGGLSLDDGETAYNRAGKLIPVPDAFREVDPADAPEPPAATLLAVLTALDTLDGIADRLSTATERRAAEVREREARAEARRAERSAAERAYYASPAGRAAAARSMAALRELVGLLVPTYRASLSRSGPVRLSAAPKPDPDAALRILGYDPAEASREADPGDGRR
jgi:hypothetical protein